MRCDETRLSDSCIVFQEGLAITRPYDCAASYLNTAPLYRRTFGPQIRAYEARPTFRKGSAIIDRSAHTPSMRGMVCLRQSVRSWKIMVAADEI